MSASNDGCVKETPQVGALEAAAGSGPYPFTATLEKRSPSAACGSGATLALLGGIVEKNCTGLATVSHVDLFYARVAVVYLVP